MKLIKIEQNCTKLTFPFVSHLLEKALEYTEGEYLLEDIYTELLNGNLTLWLGCSPEEKKIIFAATTTILRYPRYNSLLILHIGSENNKFIRHIEDLWKEDTPLTDYIKQNNIKKIEILGRNGWVKSLNKVGFKRSYTALTKKI